MFPPAAAAAELVGVRPYDLRHSFVSLLPAEGVSVVVAARPGGPLATMALSTYAHELVPLTYPRADGREGG